MRFGIRLLDVVAAALVLAGLVFVAVRLHRADERAGPVRVVDGDTVVLDGTRIRLAGIDAPELAQTCGPSGETRPCGAEARDALRRLVGGGSVTCRIEGRDKWGRAIAACRAGETDLGATLVRQGFAIAYGRYTSEERIARAAGIGLWSGPFERPDQWRKAHPRVPGI